MKLLIVGAGSIGQRHTANAVKYVETGIVDVDIEKASECAKHTGAICFEKIHDAFDWQPDAAIVAVPHDQHVNVSEKIVDMGIPVLIEKPISSNIDDAQCLLDRANKKNVDVFVACNMRFHPGVSALQQSLEAIGKPFFARAHFGNWLPNMRPGVEYQKLYCADALQGGVLMDGIHELDYLIWILGGVSAYQIDATKLSDLEINAEDYAVINMKHATGTRSEIHLDYLQQIKRRGCEIVGSEGTLIWESVGKSPEHCLVRLYKKDTEAWENIFESKNVDGNSPYIKQLELFMKSVSGEPVDDLLTGETALKELTIIKSYKDNTEVKSGTLINA